MLLTHHHSDHLSDLATFAITRWTAGATTPLPVIAPAGPAARYGDACLSIFDDDCFHAPGPTGVRTAPTHRGLIVLADRSAWRRSSIVTAGPSGASSSTIIRSSLRSATESSAPEPWSRSAATRRCAAGVHLLARGADVLVHETLLSAAVSAELLDWNAGARQVGELAAEVEPAQVVMTHLIPAPTTPADEAAFLAELRAGGYRGIAHVAHDLLAVESNPAPDSQ